MVPPGALQASQLSFLSTFHQTKPRTILPVLLALLLDLLLAQARLLINIEVATNVSALLGVRALHGSQCM